MHKKLFKRINKNDPLKLRNLMASWIKTPFSNSFSNNFSKTCVRLLSLQSLRLLSQTAIHHNEQFFIKTMEIGSGVEDRQC